MGGIKKVFNNFGITAKLVCLCVVFGIIPMTAIGFIGFDAANHMEENVGKKFEIVAKNIADKVDRNLFERYGDVQAFAQNRENQNRIQWGNPLHMNDITTAMNGYVATYGIYYLTILVDTEGTPLAVNSKDADGNPIASEHLMNKSYKNTSWFKAVSAGNFTTKMAFTAPGNDISTGTFIEDVHVDKDVKSVYPDEDGLTLGFSAPVYGEDGDIIAYWSNRTKFSLVEEIFQQTYHELKAEGYTGAELTLLDGQGRIIVDYDPVKHGTEDVVHNMEKVILKLNLAEKGVKVAQEAVAGKTGFSNALHARKQIVQAGGYTHLKGSLGYPGMNWSVLVRIPQEEAAAASTSLKSSMGVTGLVCLLLMLPLGWWAGRIGAGRVKSIQEVAEKMANGDYGVRVESQSSDEVGHLGQAFNQMAQEIQIKNEEMASKAAAEAQAAEQQKEQAAKLQEGVTQIASIATTLASAAEELNSVSSQMGGMAEETSSQANVVSAAAEEVSTNIQSVAAGAEEMSASIKEIAKNTTDSARVAAQAVTVAETTNTTVAKLGQSSAEISSIIKVINSIAEQTNLLALNATIEAARAGEAGKGFAVVANEVKELAKETTKATENIGNMIETIQEDTKGAVDAIGQISEIIKQVNDFQNTVASAVEEQSVTTNEMSRNVTEASKGGMEIANNITNVAQAAESTNEGTKQTKEAAEELAKMASNLQTVVSQLT